MYVSFDVLFLVLFFFVLLFPKSLTHWNRSSLEQRKRTPDLYVPAHCDQALVQRTRLLAFALLEFEIDVGFPKVFGV